MNPSIEELYRNKELSTSTYIVCKHANFHTVEDLIEYLKEYNSFENIKVSNGNSNIELIEICWKYTNLNIDEEIENIVNISSDSKEFYQEKKRQRVQDNSNEKINNEVLNLSKKKLDEITYANISLKELSDKENLSARTYNICENNELLDLNKIKVYFLKRGTFINLRNCGRRSNLELTNLCSKYNLLEIDSQLITEIIDHENPIVYLINDFNESQKTIVDGSIINIYSQLSRRSKNVLDKLLNNSITLNGLKNIIFTPKQFSIIQYENVGRKSEKEINLFIEKIKQEIERVAGLTSTDELRLEKLDAILISKFNVDRKIFFDIKNNYDLSQGIPIFKIINILIAENYILKKNEKVVFNNSMGFFDSQKIQSLEKTGIKIGVTRERVRQIRERSLKYFNRNFSFIDLFKREHINLYGLDTTSLFLNIDDKFIRGIQTKENVNYNKVFINRILSILFKEEYRLIGNDNFIVIGRAIRNIYNWKTTYLISKSLANIFDFEKIIKNIYSELVENKKRDCKFNFKTFVLKNTLGDNTTHTKEILQIVKFLVINEFGSQIEFENDMILKKNTNKRIYEIIVEILNIRKTPMHYNDIYKECNLRKIKITSAASIHSNMINHSEIFGLKGSGTYGLLEWGGYFGTIGDVTEKKMRELNEPIIMKELEEFLVRELYISQDSIREVLFNYKAEDRFIKLKNGKISLKEWL